MFRLKNSSINHNTQSTRNNYRITTHRRMTNTNRRRGNWPHPRRTPQVPNAPTSRPMRRVNRKTPPQGSITQPQNNRMTIASGARVSIRRLQPSLTESNNIDRTRPFNPHYMRSRSTSSRKQRRRLSLRQTHNQITHHRY